MKRIIPLVATALIVLSAAVYSRNQPAATSEPAGAKNDLKIKTEEKNPWTGLNLNKDPELFRFAVVTDRTGGHREKIFSRAVHQINLLQPEFVMSVGDLIEGYTADEDKLNQEWAEFNGFIKKLEMPFFYVPGNHDLSNKEQIVNWKGRFGRKFYHFSYKNVLFLAMNSEDPVDKVSEDQLAYFKQALAENEHARWTLAFIHKPLWTKDTEKNGWGEVEKLLAGRKHTVFCGHVHRYKKYLRNGANYYQLATTGGGSFLRGAKFGEFDHIVWISMKKEGPVIANLMLDGILPEDLSIPDTEETAFPRKQEKTYPVRGKVLMAGKPVAGATVRFFKIRPTGKYDFVSEAYTDETGAFATSTYKAYDGAPEGEFTAIVLRGVNPGPVDFEPQGKSTLPEKYATPKTSPLRVTIRAEDKNEPVLELSE